MSGDNRKRFYGVHCDCGEFIKEAAISEGVAPLPSTASVPRDASAGTRTCTKCGTTKDYRWSDFVIEDVGW
jgi:hypothetical protein